MPNENMSQTNSLRKPRTLWAYDISFWNDQRCDRDFGESHHTARRAPPDTCSSRSPSSHLFEMRRLSIEWASRSRVPRELWEGSRRACPVPACQLRNRDLTVVMCSVSTIVRRTERGIQSGCDDGLHDGRTGEHDAPTARRSYLSQSIPLPRILRTSLIKVCCVTLIFRLSLSSIPHRITMYYVFMN